MAIRELEREWENQGGLEFDDCPGEVSPGDLWAELDQKAHEWLNMSAATFVQQYRQGQLPDTYVVAELGFLLRCIDEDFIPI